ncbi:hypothetical protein GQ44DRAFT_624219 [Phaeosphaeriaceae sp. PMI808]|nr:hypothetical protein GQ44DRAFT_624219 [Phaeosphaeriaceae sp. PMI808]
MVTRLILTSGHKQLFLLLYSHAVLDDYHQQVYQLQADYARKKEGLSDPRRANLTARMLAEITRDAYFYEEVSERVSNLAGAIDALVESLKLQPMNTDETRQFQSLAVDLQSTCTDLKRIMATLSATLENHLRLFELSRGIQDAQKVRLLSILASIFLPLSLATGLLSMQTRFANLHYLIYDFFGVLVLLGSIVIVILIMLKTYLWWKELLLQLRRNSLFRKHIIPKSYIAFVCFFLLMWALFLSSFLVGMIRDVDLGLKILSYGVAAAVAVSAPLPLFVFLVIICVYVVVKFRRR